MFLILLPKRAKGKGGRSEVALERLKVRDRASRPNITIDITARQLCDLEVRHAVSRDSDHSRDDRSNSTTARMPPLRVQAIAVRCISRLQRHNEDWPTNNETRTIAVNRVV